MNSRSALNDRTDFPPEQQGYGEHAARVGKAVSEQQDLLTVVQAAQYLQLSTSSIRSYIREGKLKAFRIAGLRKVLIPRTELLLLLEPTGSQHKG